MSGSIRSKTIISCNLHVKKQKITVKTKPGDSEIATMEICERYDTIDEEDTPQAIAVFIKVA